MRGNPGGDCRLASGLYRPPGHSIRGGSTIMIRVRAKGLLSGVSSLAVLAAFVAVDPVLAAGTTVTGRSFFVNIDTTVTNPPGTTGGNNDFIVVNNDAIITTSGGRSFFNPATIAVGTGATAVLIDDAV